MRMRKLLINGCMYGATPYIRSFMSDLRILGFDPFLKLAMHVQTARSPRLFNGFQCFFGAKWSWGLVCFVSTLHSSVRSPGEGENFEWSKKVRIFQVFFFICTSCVLVKMLEKSVKILSSQIGDGCFFKLSSLVVRTPIFSRFGG